MKNIRIFLSENFQFLEVKLSIYLNRRVFVMMSDSVYPQQRSQTAPDFGSHRLLKPVCPKTSG